MENLVSIIIPVYNAKDFIVDCLKSVVSQTFQGSLECILVDDCGNDNSIQLAVDWLEVRGERLENSFTNNKELKFALTTPSKILTIKILHQTHNQGPSAARNRGIWEATGEYVFFLDADDTITPICIETLYNKAKAHKLDYVQGSYEGEGNKFTNSPILDKKNLILDKRDIKRTLLNYNLIPFTPHNRLVRRQMLLDHELFFNEEIRVREDFLWMTFVAKHVKRFGYCPEVTYVRGYNEYSLTHNINIEREIKGYTVLIRTMIENLDPFQRGAQMELILNAIAMFKGVLLSSRISELKNYTTPLEKLFFDKNSSVEQILYKLYKGMNDRVLKTKVLHLLIRLYKLKD